MKYLRLLLLPLLLWAGLASAQVGPPNQIQCNHLGQLSTSAATVTSGVLTNEFGAVLRGVAGQRINICGWHVTNTTSATQGTFQIVAGTDAATTPGCGGTQSLLTPAYGVTSTAPSSDHIDFASLSVATGQQVCVTTTGAVSLQVGVWYSQQ